MDGCRHNDYSLSVSNPDAGLAADSEAQMVQLE